MIQVTCAVIVETGQVLVTQRSQEMPHPLKWEFPGGKVREGETPELCVRREIREELGIEISIVQRLPVVEHAYGEDSIQLIPFICRHVDGLIELAEHRAYEWVSGPELDALDWLEADVEVVDWLREKL